MRAETSLRRASLATKRGLDVVGAASALVVLSPVIAAVAVALLATQGRPILFRQQRPGLHGRPFTILKFRTMRAPHEGEVWYLTDEDRLTRLGRLLRATSIDEIPEFWNVLRGDMSLVGPRPLLVEYLDDYTSEEIRRHEMRPGVTGWAVVNGRNILPFRDRLRLDVWYVDHWSLRLDVRILLKTVRLVITRSDATSTEDLALGFPLAMPDGDLPDVGTPPVARSRSVGEGGSGEGDLAVVPPGSLCGRSRSTEASALGHRLRDPSAPCATVASASVTYSTSSSASRDEKGRASVDVATRSVTGKSPGL